MLKEIHLLLTYRCTLECDHCFLYCSPRSGGTMTLNQINAIIDEADKIGSIEMFYFEGGEPFLFYPLLLAAVEAVKARGYKAGIVTNAYWATNEHDAELWLRPLTRFGIDDLSISDDSFHNINEENNFAKNVLIAAEKLDIPVTSICIEKPQSRKERNSDLYKGRSVTGGNVMLKGRAAEKLTEGLPLLPWYELVECLHEELKYPSRVHIDCYGNVHLCQGISIGNMLKQPLSEIVNEYDSDLHPICAPLLEGGPALLARIYDVPHNKEYADECHFCFSIRKELLDKFPSYLTPRQVYGLEVD